MLPQFVVYKLSAQQWKESFSKKVGLNKEEKMKQHALIALLNS